MLRQSRFITLVMIAAMTFFSRLPAADAGCGCDKPPPLPATVRPSAAYPGAPISVIDPALQVGKTYTVTFASGISGQAASVSGQAAVRRDLADGLEKTQLVVPLPTVSLGPVSVVVIDPSTGGEVVFVPDTELTVVPSPVVVPAQAGTYSFKTFQGAVGRDGTVYVALDLTNVVLPLVIDAQSVGYPLRFSAAGVSIHNVQGILMQQLESQTQPIPGMYVMPAASADLSTKSDILHYSRHEFETFFLQHQERQAHALDPADGNWHLDGTKHTDHNHLVLAISGTLTGGALPTPGATAPFTLSLKTYSLFYQGLVGTASVGMSGAALTDSYDMRTLLYGAKGDVFTNGTLTMAATNKINGNATAKSFSLKTGALITGTKTTLTTAQSFMAVTVPPGLPSLGSISVSSGTRTIQGPGSFLATGIALSKTSTLYIDNSAGPVTLYVSGTISIASTSRVVTADPNPEKFAIYVTNTSSVSLAGGSSVFRGVVYAPSSTVTVSNGGDFFGAFVGKAISLTGGAKVHYEESLRGQ